MPCRWLQKRARRYRHITSDFCDANMLETEDIGEGIASCVVPPLLPSLLAACAASTELKLHVAPDQGKSAPAVSHLVLSSCAAQQWLGSHAKLARCIWKMWRMHPCLL